MFSKLKSNTVEVHYKNSFAALKITDFLIGNLTSNSAIVCIGTDKCIVDTLGPLVGTMLIKSGVEIDVYGTLENPIHAINLNERLREVYSKNYDNILAIDACLSNKKIQGVIEIRDKPITPGKGIGKYLSEVGDFSIVGVIDAKDKEFQSLLQETRLSFVYEMAEVVTDGILKAVALC